MPSKIRYLFDSDVLITAARVHYAPAYCQAFWDWLTEGHKKGLFYSIDKVKKELLDGNKDPLNDWAGSDNLNNFFYASLPALGQWKKISNFALDPAKGFTSAAKSKFLDADKADAWLIAYAAQEGNLVIVTNEASAPNSKADIKLPDAAAWLGVKTVKLYDILKIHAGHNFTLKTVSTSYTPPAVRYFSAVTPLI